MKILAKLPMFSQEKTLVICTRVTGYRITEMNVSKLTLICVNDFAVTYKTCLCANSGQAVSASSHPRRARPGESGCDCPGSAGAIHIEASATVGCLT